MKACLRAVKAVGAGRRDARGELLIEVLVALALLGLVAVVFIGGIYTSLQSARLADESSVGLTLAKSQLEFAKTKELADYSDTDWDYTVDTIGWTATTPPAWLAGQPSDHIALSGEYAGYSVQVTGVSDIDLDGEGGPDEGIRTLTATALHNGEEVFTLKNYEVHR